MSDTRRGGRGGGIERFPIITAAGPEGQLLEVPIVDPHEQAHARAYWFTLKALRDVVDAAQDSLENDNQQFVPEQVRMWDARIETARRAVREFRPVELTDADGRMHELNTDPAEAMERYHDWLEERDRAI